ncbi:MAG: amino acid-binding protein [Actinobacteria bacterium]|nr:amino acid-binding protein [Actinomycetota bacterium]
MLEEIIVTVDDRPGVLADVGEMLGRSEVNIQTLCAFTHQGLARIHLIVDDGEEAGEVLASNGFKVEATRAVLTATLDDRPGELGRYCRRLADAGVTISGAYLAGRSAGESELIFAVDDLDVAKTL